MHPHPPFIHGLNISIYFFTWNTHKIQNTPSTNDLPYLSIHLPISLHLSDSLRHPTPSEYHSPKTKCGSRHSRRNKRLKNREAQGYTYHTTPDQKTGHIVLLISNTTMKEKRGLDHIEKVGIPKNNRTLWHCDTAKTCFVVQDGCSLLIMLSMNKRPVYLVVQLMSRQCFYHTWITWRISNLFASCVKHTGAGKLSVNNMFEGIMDCCSTRKSSPNGQCSWRSRFDLDAPKAVLPIPAERQWQDLRWDRHVWCMI